MALNTFTTNQQIQRLKQQSAAASHCAHQLIIYKKELTMTWAGTEVGYLCSAIDLQIQKYETLSIELDRLSRDMAQAVEDNIREEFAVSEGM